MTEHVGELWVRWFSWYPVRVDAYRPDEIRRGYMNYWVWLEPVEYALAYGSKESPAWKYRLLDEPSRGVWCKKCEVVHHIPIADECWPHVVPNSDRRSV